LTIGESTGGTYIMPTVGNAARRVAARASRSAEPDRPGGDVQRDDASWGDVGAALLEELDRY
jgi:hypothetical protein